MRFNRLKTLLVPAIITIVIVACGKDNGPKDTEKPVMSISQPTEGQLVDLSVDSLHILLNITENDKLESFTATLKTGSETIYTDSPADAKGVNYYIYHRHFNPHGISTHTDAELTLVATDRSGNSETKVINFAFEP